jgi:hypothetical protein
LTTKKDTPSQKSVKKPWKGELAAEGFCRSKVEKECVKTRSVNFPLPLRREGVVEGLEGVEGLAVGVVVVLLSVLAFDGGGEGGMVEPLVCFRLSGGVVLAPGRPRS